MFGKVQCLAEPRLIMRRDSTSTKKPGSSFYVALCPKIVDMMHCRKNSSGCFSEVHGQNSPAPGIIPGRFRRRQRAADGSYRVAIKMSTSCTLRNSRRCQRRNRLIAARYQWLWRIVHATPHEVVMEHKRYAHSHHELRNAFIRLGCGLMCLMAFLCLSLIPSAVDAEDQPPESSLVTLIFSPYVVHYERDPEHNSYPWFVALEWESPSRWELGGAFFKNSFHQPCGYLYGGKRWIYGSPDQHMFFKITAGAIIGYFEPYENKLPVQRQRHRTRDYSGHRLQVQKGKHPVRGAWNVRLHDHPRLRYLEVGPLP